MVSQHGGVSGGSCVDLWLWRILLQRQAGADGTFFLVCVDPQHFAHATISTIACGAFHSASVTAVVALYTWGQGGAEDTGPGARRPGKLLQTDMPILPTVEQARADAVAATVAGRDVRGSVPRAP